MAVQLTRSVCEGSEEVLYTQCNGWGWQYYGVDGSKEVGNGRGEHEEDEDMTDNGDSDNDW